MTAPDWTTADQAFYEALRAEVIRLGWPIVKNYCAPLGYRKVMDVPADQRDALLYCLRKQAAKSRG